MHAHPGKRTLEKRAFIAGKPGREQTEIQESREVYVILSLSVMDVTDVCVSLCDSRYRECLRVIFEDSPSCPSLDDPTQPHPCKGCPLMKFVPDELQKENSPCWLIPLNEQGETIDYLDR
jgi:hypothetical protein